MTDLNHNSINNQWVTENTEPTKHDPSHWIESQPALQSLVALDPNQQRRFLELTRSGGGRLCFKPVNGTFKEMHFSAVDEALKLIKQFGHNADAWVSMATYSDPNVSRSQKNAECLSALWIDVDAHAGCRYSTVQEVKHAVANFVEVTALPAPNLVHLTGHGMHVLWTFSESIPTHRWQIVAAKLQELTVRWSLEADPITADAARILRVPGTMNFRDAASPRKCKLVGTDRELLKFDSFSDAVDNALAGAPAITQAGSGYSDSKGNRLSESPGNIAIVEKMLSEINPDIGYPEWRSVTWATKSTEWKVSYDLARSWSAKGKLWDEKAFDRVWNSYDPAGGTSFGTLVHFARLYGYTGPLPTSDRGTAGNGEITNSTHCKLITACASDIHPEPVDWLVDQSIPLGAMVVLGGQPGMGKSQIAISLAASITTGNGLPNGSTFDKQGSVIILANEDDSARTIRPRLDAAGADLTKVHIVQGVSRESRAADLFQLATDICELRNKAEALGDVRLIIIDPPSAYLGSKVDAYKDSDVRQVLTPLGNLAQETGALILLVVHLNKRSDAGAQQRFGGSTAWVAAPRAAFLVAEDSATRERYMVPVKNNLGDDRTGFTYQIQEKLLTYGDQTIKAPYVKWLGKSQTTAGDLLEPPRRNSSTAVDEAQSFLKDQLSAGKLKVADLRLAAEAAGVSWASIQRAKQTMPIASKRVGDGWAWEMIQEDDNV